MPTRTTLTIPQPCHENWAAMAPATQGRHCAACDKVVVDFTEKTDAEILALLGQASSSCGRFREDQLQRPLLPLPVPAPRWRTWLAATAAVLGLREVVAPVVRAQQPEQTQLAVKKIEKLKAPLRTEPMPRELSPTIVRGRIIDKNTGDGLPGVTVLIKNTSIGISTNTDGTFELQIPVSTVPYQALVFSSVGYVTCELSLEEVMATQELLVKLAADTQALSGEVIVAGGYVRRQPWPWHPRALWYRIKYAFSR